MEKFELKELYDFRMGLEDEQSKLMSKLKDKWFFQIFSKTYLKWKLEDLVENLEKTKNKFNNNLNQFLLQDNSKYEKLVSENRHLVTKNDFTLRVYRTDLNYVGSTEKLFTGYISNKGYLYLFIKKTNIAIFDYQNNLMSKEFSGTFDELGNFSAKSIKTDFNYFMPRIPETYKARALPNHSFIMVAEEKEWDMSGKRFVDRMFGDPFNDDYNDRNTYLDNREKIELIQSQFIDTL